MMNILSKQLVSLILSVLLFLGNGAPVFAGESLDNLSSRAVQALKEFSKSGPSPEYYSKVNSVMLSDSELDKLAWGDQKPNLERLKKLQKKAELFEQLEKRLAECAKGDKSKKVLESLINSGKFNCDEVLQSAINELSEFSEDWAESSGKIGENKKKDFGRQLFDNLALKNAAFYSERRALIKVPDDQSEDALGSFFNGVNSSDPKFKKLKEKINRVQKEYSQPKTSYSLAQAEASLQNLAWERACSFYDAETCEKSIKPKSKQSGLMQLLSPVKSDNYCTSFHDLGLKSGKIYSASQIDQTSAMKDFKAKCLKDDLYKRTEETKQKVLHNDLVNVVTLNGRNGLADSLFIDYEPTVYTSNKKVTYSVQKTSKDFSIINSRMENKKNAGVDFAGLNISKEISKDKILAARNESLETLSGGMNLFACHFYESDSNDCKNSFKKLGAELQGVLAKATGNDKTDIFNLALILSDPSQASRMMASHPKTGLASICNALKYADNQGKIEMAMTLASVITGVAGGLASGGTSLALVAAAGSVGIMADMADFSNKGIMKDAYYSACVNGNPESCKEFSAAVEEINTSKILLAAGAVPLGKMMKVLKRQGGRPSFPSGGMSRMATALPKRMSKLSKKFSAFEWRKMSDKLVGLPEDVRALFLARLGNMSDEGLSTFKSLSEKISPAQLKRNISEWAKKFKKGGANNVCPLF